MSTCQWTSSCILNCPSTSWDQYGLIGHHDGRMLARLAESECEELNCTNMFIHHSGVLDGCSLFLISIFCHKLQRNFTSGLLSKSNEKMAQAVEAGFYL